MSRDYSAFGGVAAPAPEPSLLTQLGWQSFFMSQCDTDELESCPPVRVTSAHRSKLDVLGEGIDMQIPLADDATAGDWLLLDRENPAHSRRLDRKTLFQRRAAGLESKAQLIAANIDTAFITTSCNRDFNIARLERYIALTIGAGAQAVILLTKPDLTDDIDRFIDDAKSISPDVEVIAINGKEDDAKARLKPWCKTGQTIAFLGSSGVGKSTLVNALSGEETAATNAIREADSKGRHTTTNRRLHILPDGYCVLDTPGMRELQLMESEGGISELFEDIVDLTHKCRFRDCAHESEPKCAVQDAVKSGTLDPARLERWRKLSREDAHNSASIAERRAGRKTFAKMVKEAISDKKNKK